MRLLHRAGPDGRELSVKILAVEAHVFAGPGQLEELFRLVNAVGLLDHVGAETGVLERVVARPTADPDDQPAVAEVVDQRGLDGGLYGLVEGHLDDRDPQGDPLGFHGDRRSKDDGVGVGNFAGKVMFGEPDRVVTELFGKSSLR